MNEEQERLYGEFEVTARDVDGNVLKKRTVEGPASFAIEDVKQNSLLHGVDEYHIEPVWLELRRGDETTGRIERTDGGPFDDGGAIER